MPRLSVRPRPLSLIVAAWLCALVAGANPALAQAPLVRWTGTTVSITAAGVPLAQILTELARHTGSVVVGLEKATEPVTIELDQVTLRHALRELLADKNYIYLDRSSEIPAGESVRLWVYGKGAGAWPSSCRAVIGGRPVPCADADGQGAVQDAPAAAVATFTTEPFGQGPSAAEAEVARLNDSGFFNVNAPTGQLLSGAKSPDANVRIRSLEMLAVQGTSQALAALDDAVNDEHPFVRSAAMDLLASLGGSSAAGTRRLGDMLASPDPVARFTAATALAEQPGSEAEALLQRAVQDEDPAVKAVAAQALEQRRGEQRKRRIPQH